jgi:hypothetical protein
VDRLLNKLKREGEIFDPRPAMWGLTWFNFLANKKGYISLLP